MNKYLEKVAAKLNKAVKTNIRYAVDSFRARPLVEKRNKELLTRQNVHHSYQSKADRNVVNYKSKNKDVFGSKDNFYRSSAIKHRIMAMDARKDLKKLEGK